MSDLFFIGLGGTDEVGASSYLYRLGGHNLLIDAGMRPGGVGEAALPRLDLLLEFPPEAMILTHAHLDHVCALPRITRLYPKLPIYCTAATARIVTLVLADTIKVSTEQGYPLFNDTDMKRALERLRVIPYKSSLLSFFYARPAKRADPARFRGDIKKEIFISFFISCPNIPLTPFAPHPES